MESCRRTDKEPLKSCWRIDGKLMESHWRAVGEVLESRWRAVEELMESHWRAIWEPLESHQTVIERVIFGGCYNKLSILSKTFIFSPFMSYLRGLDRLVVISEKGDPIYHSYCRPASI